MDVFGLRGDAARQPFGVGYLITHAYTVGRTDVVIAGMISISVVGALLDMAFQWIERRKYAWKQFSR